MGQSKGHRIQITRRVDVRTTEQRKYAAIQPPFLGFTETVTNHSFGGLGSSGLSRK